MRSKSSKPNYYSKEYNIRRPRQTVPTSSAAGSASHVRESGNGEREKVQDQHQHIRTTTPSEVPIGTYRGRKQNLRRRGLDFIHIDASGSVVDPLVNFFRMREKRLRR